MCNTGALDYVMINGKSYNDVTLDKALCVDCGECIEICPGEAFEK
jgi:Fe-S-cluster-containing hydrogenase component 2